jgi:hypothetical protein
MPRRLNGLPWSKRVDQTLAAAKAQSWAILLDSATSLHDARPDAESYAEKKIAKFIHLNFLPVKEN